jgi:DNA-binding GntR family transcriptional regulator
LQPAAAASNVTTMRDQRTFETDSASTGSSLTDQVYRALKEDILAARLGSEPIVEAALAKEYGVSKTPVREALRQLTHEGLVIVLPRKGYLVRPMGVSDIVEVMDLRAILEPPLAAAAARNRSQADVERIERLLARTTPSSPSLDEVSLSLQAHEFIADMAGNRRAATLVRSLLDETARIPWLVPGLSIYLGEGEHDEVFRAIARGDAGGAEKAMAAHLDAAKASTLLGLGAR